MKYIKIHDPKNRPGKSPVWLCFDDEKLTPMAQETHVGQRVYPLGNDGWAVRMVWFNAPPEHDPITAAMFADWLMEYLPNDEYVMSVVNRLKTIAGCNA